MKLHKRVEYTVLLSALFLLLPIAYAEDSILPDRQVLELLYDRCNGDEWTSRDNWKDSYTPICQWEGIECTLDAILGSDDEDDATIGSSKHVVESIDLTNNNLIGTVPLMELLQMPALKVLKLSENFLTYGDVGTFDAIDSSVVYLDLINTNIHNLDNVFPDFLKFNQIKDLYLGYNDIAGSFPKQLFSMSRTLEKLKLEANAIEGTLPPELWDFTRLKSIELDNNYFTGSIPSSISRLRKLKVRM